MKEALMSILIFIPLLTTVLPSLEISADDCYDLGYRYGLCGAQSLQGIPCRPENDIVIPETCRGRPETEKGIQAGVKAVYDSLNLDSGRSKSQSIDMLTTSLDVLQSKLAGKSKGEVKDLVGNPSRIEHYLGKECWIYGNSYTSKDRGIVFEGEKVLTVTFY
jgi:hypothetical protein